MKFQFLKIFLFLLISPILLFAQSDTLTTESGLQYIIVKKTDGEKVVEGQEIHAHYTGKFLNGKKFDSSYDRNEPIYFILGNGNVIPGWEEGINLMNVGDKYTFIIPPSLAYGEKGAGDIIPPNSTLVFDVEVVKQENPLISTAEALYIVLEESGADSAKAKYYELKRNFPEIFDFREMELVKLGYKLMREEKIDFANAVFELNLDNYPKSEYSLMGLAECAEFNNEMETALSFYKKVIGVNPENDEAIEKINKLESGKNE
ncbi:MAG: FKBP-type peptidyl-prolyl cis-trans isomerase [Melioribacteraceae bacterium]|nr:FKBP-type peptidyl-prolyl cis-trans isomerase [Melioribacteraceae bacterium]MCF8266386.1 FKBP-type peptidyl-prolyl cis-trans isomerase [Melioribacteraceae bacterium]MCF8412903.1 FKBP-type peptidyl-prolyl cis-trans isomerase [Melioribacteraceae bacterium]